MVNHKIRGKSVGIDETAAHLNFSLIGGLNNEVKDSTLTVTLFNQID